LDIKKIALIALFGGVITACQPDGTTDTTEEVKAITKSDISIKEDDQIGYAIGAKMATFIRTDIEKYDLPSLNKQSIAMGFNDGLEDSSKMTEEQINQKFIEFQQMIQALQQQQAAVEQQKNKELAEVAKLAGDAFLAENAKKEGVVTTESGLQYSVIKAGSEDSAKPSATDTVEVHYHGTFVDGKVFDSSVDRGETISFPLNRVIKGWTEGLQLMTVGSKYHFVIPWELAYGAQGRPGSIPGHSVLQFEVELFAINPKEEQIKTEAEEK